TSRSIWYLGLIYGALHADVLLAAETSPTDDTPVRELTVSEFLAEISSPRAETAPVTVPDVPQHAATLDATPEATLEATPEAESSSPTLDEYLESVEQWGRISQPESETEEVQADTGPWLGEPAATEAVVENAAANV